MSEREREREREICICRKSRIPFWGLFEVHDTGFSFSRECRTIVLVIIESPTVVLLALLRKPLRL